MNSPHLDNPLVLRGDHAAAELFFLAVEPPDPLGGHPSLQLQGRPYNDWLTDEILRPAAERWSRSGPPGRAGRAEIRKSFEASSGAARLAFARILPSASAAGEPAVLAALGVTANLQRTLAMLAEFVLDERPAAARVVFRLSRRWSGLLEYPENAPYFPGRIKRPAAPARLRPNRRDPRHLCNALWCSTAEVKARCAEAIDRLRREIRQNRARSGE